MDLTTIIIFTTISILIAAITLGITMARRTEAPKRRPVPGGDLHPLNPAAAEGITYKNKYRPKAKNTPPSLTIEADFGFPAPIIFKVESKMERFGKAIGLANEVQTGDQAFDEAVYVDSPYPDYAAAMLADSDNRRAIRSCFAAQPQLARIECLP